MDALYKIASDVCEHHMDEIKAVVERMIKLNYVAKNEGLLALESYMYEEEDYPEKNFVDRMIEFIVNGNQWEQIDGFLTNRILLMDSNKKRYLCRMYKECMKVIQAGNFFYWQKECISALIPEKYQEEICAFIDEVDDIEDEKWKKIKDARIDKEYSQIKIEFPEDIIKEMRSFEANRVLKASAKSIQTWLRLVEYEDIYYLLLVGSEEFRQIIFANMSSRMQQVAKEEVVNLARDWEISQMSKIRQAILNGMLILDAEG